MSDGYFQQLGKLLKMVDCLAKPQGARIQDLRKVLECEERTVYRWINTLEELGFPLEELDGDRHKRYRLIDTYVKKMPNISIPDFGLSLSDILLLYVVLSQDRVTRGTHMEERRNNLIRRLSAMLSDEERKLADAVEGLVVPNLKPQKDYSDKEQIIDILTEAILLRRRCVVQYRSFSKKKDVRFQIHPLHFFESQGGLYVMVQLARMAESFEDVADTLRVLAVERILDIHKTGETFEYPNGLKPAELLSQAFDVVWNDPIEITVWFSAHAAPYVKERVWPGKYSWTENDDGSLLFHLKTSGYDDVKRWVLSFGRDAKVLKPKRLRANLAAVYQDMAREYAAPSRRPARKTAPPRGKPMPQTA
ncbi:MAG: WYL domain-containing protein [Desulfosoma sp.]